MAIINVSAATMSDASGASLQAVVNSANSGDTLSLPTGTWTFTNTSTVNFTKSLTINAQAGHGTVGTYGPPLGTLTSGQPATGTGLSVLIKYNSATGQMWDFTSGTDGHIRVDGIYFYQQANNQGSVGNMMLHLDRTDQGGKGSPGTQYTVIFTNCYFDSGWNGQVYLSYASANGLIFSHCTFTNTPGLALCGVSFTTSKYGFTSTWNTPSTMGLGPDNLLGPGGDHLNVGDTAQGWCGVAGFNNSYVEDCTVHEGTEGTFNGDDNSRVVIRHCDCYSTGLFTHGQDTGPVGNRHYEVYNNNFTNIDGQTQSWFLSRGGTFIVANNFFDSIVGKNIVNMQCQQVTRTSGQTQCQVLPGPANRQVGVGWSSSSNAGYGNPVQTQDGTGQILDPAYIWNNTGPGTTGVNGSVYFSVTDFNPDQCGHGLSATQFIIKGTHFFVDVSGGPAQRPGWAPFTYPHPALNTTPQPPPPPTLSSIITGPTPSFVQANSGSVTPGGSSTIIQATYNSAQAAGDKNIVIVWLGSGNVLQSVNPILDTAGNTYSLLPGFPTVTPNLNFNVYVFISAAITHQNPGVNTVTATQTTSSFGEIAILEYNSITATPFDAFTDAGDGTGTTSTGSSPITTVNPDDLIISGFICDINFSTLRLPGTVTSPPGWNLETTASSNPPASYGTSFVADLQAYSTGTYTPTWSQNVTNPNPGNTGNQWAIFSLALKSALTTPPGQSQINLSWTSVSGATAYHVKYGTTNGGPYNVVINVFTATSFTLSGLTAGTYYLVVSAFNSIGESVNSNQVTAVVSSGAIPINASVLIR